MLYKEKEKEKEKVIKKRVKRKEMNGLSHNIIDMIFDEFHWKDVENCNEVWPLVVENYVKRKKDNKFANIWIEFAKYQEFIETRYTDKNRKICFYCCKYYSTKDDRNCTRCGVHSCLYECKTVLYVAERYRLDNKYCMECFITKFNEDTEFKRKYLCEGNHYICLHCNNRYPFPYKDSHDSFNICCFCQKYVCNFCYDNNIIKGVYVMYNSENDVFYFIDEYGDITRYFQVCFHCYNQPNILSQNNIVELIKLNFIAGYGQDFFTKKHILTKN